MTSTTAASAIYEVDVKRCHYNVLQLVEVPKNIILDKKSSSSLQDKFFCAIM